MAAKLKKGDKVVVLTGKDKGKTGEIQSVDPKAGKAVVEGVNIAIRHRRQSQTAQGGRSPRRCRSTCRTSPIVDCATASPAASASAWRASTKVRFAKSTGEAI